MDSLKSISRRQALKILGGTGALVVCMPLVSLAANKESQNADALFQGKLGPFVQINADNSIVIGSPVQDMGTGITTSLPMIVANELDANWNEITVEILPASLSPNEKGEPVRNFSLQGSAGSGTVTNAWQPLRECGALARHLILIAAAKDLSLTVDELKTENSHVVVKSTAKKYPYSQFADAAAKVQVAGLGTKVHSSTYITNRVVFNDVSKGGPQIKARGKGPLVGQPKKQKLAHDIVTGNLEYGIDKNFEYQLYAQIERCPYYYGNVKSFDASNTLLIKGVVDVIRVPSFVEEGSSKMNSPGIAVIADSFWAAKKGRDALHIIWNKGPNTHENNAWHEQELLGAITRIKSDKQVLLDTIERNEARIIDEKGDVSAALKYAAKTFEAQYEVPHFTHLCMEPISCSAWVKEHEIIIKTGHQFPANIITYIAENTDVPFENIKVENGRMGGGYGRKAEVDFVHEAMFLSQKTGRPVKVYWTREDDVRHGFINPTSLHQVKAGVDKQGKLIAWDILASRQLGAKMKGFPEKVIPNTKLLQVRPNIKVPVGSWRGPGHNTIGFVHEGMLDEIAVGLGRDPLEYRLEVLSEDKDYPYDGWTPVPGDNKTISSTRMKTVLRLAAEKAGWGQKQKKGHGRGIASCFTFGSYAAIVVDVCVDDNGKLIVNKVTGAADCGLVINPLGTKSQMEGGCMDGLSAVLYQNVRFEEGRISTGNFDDIPLVRINESPKVFDFHFVDSDEIPTGIGEVALPPFIPALMNAIYDATGKRITKLPLGEQLIA